ncbi:hypothetical protein [Marinicauda pacifica]|uniref:Uncharacterized protein n=1 Tax=Marinicauda pacifica TaxID=1133559 RepID=A0A4V3RZ04_9PROT|nr:hypothetical protein [Marinicauda pacifica]TGY92439.1 hypothetical protein E5162_12415 [Marinicauda pacifica]
MGESETWCASVNRLFVQRYAIDIQDIGFDDEYLERCYSSGEAASEFVERIASKFDLDPRTAGYRPQS